jgi:hypothetical protein
MKQTAFLIICTIFLNTVVANADEINYVALVKGSDDYNLYKKIFASSAKKLIKSGKCDANDFAEMGGWIKSSNYLVKPIYFTYCGGMRNENKLYLNRARWIGWMNIEVARTTFPQGPRLFAAW